MSSSSSKHGYSACDPVYVINVFESLCMSKRDFDNSNLQDTAGMTSAPDAVQLMKLEALQDEIQQIDCALCCL